MTAGSNFAGYKSNFENFMFYIINLKISFEEAEKKNDKKKKPLRFFLKKGAPFVESFLKLK